MSSNKGTDKLGGRHIDFERSEQVALLFGYFVQDQFAPHPGHLLLGELVDHNMPPDSTFAEEIFPHEFIIYSY